MAALDPHISAIDIPGINGVIQQRSNKTGPSKTVLVLATPLQFRLHASPDELGQEDADPTLYLPELECPFGWDNYELSQRFSGDTAERRQAVEEAVNNNTGSFKFTLWAPEGLAQKLDELDKRVLDIFDKHKVQLMGRDLDRNVLQIMQVPLLKRAEQPGRKDRCSVKFNTRSTEVYVASEQGYMKGKLQDITRDSTMKLTVKVDSIWNQNNQFGMTMSAVTIAVRKKAAISGLASLGIDPSLEIAGVPGEPKAEAHPIEDEDGCVKRQRVEDAPSHI